MRKLLLLAVLMTSLVQARELPVMELTAGFHRIEAEVAANNPDRMQGLMHRKAMPQQHGMLFVFPSSAPHCFWMKNTLIPLSIAFLDERGHILNIEEMQPQTENNHCAAKPARFALEMNAGWFAQRGIRPGDPIGGLERAPRGQ